MTVSRRRLVTAGIVTFAAGLIIMLPARVAYRWIAPTEIQASGISGSIWSGTAREASINGVYLRDISWRGKPWRLATGSLTYHVTGKPVTAIFESDVSIGLGGTIVLSSLIASLPLDVVSGAIGIRGLQGSSRLQFERIELSDGIPVSAIGELQVTDLLVPLLGQYSLGGYTAEFMTQDGVITAIVEDTNGVVDLNGQLHLDADRSYKFTGQVAAIPDTPAGITQQLKFLGSANDRGQHELRFEGTL